MPITSDELSYIEGVAGPPPRAMSIDGWGERVFRDRRRIGLVALLTTFAGLALLIDAPKGTISEWLALPLLVIGGVLFAWAVWPRAANPSDQSTTLAGRVIRRLTFDGRIVPFFPLVGFGLFLADLVYNLRVSATPAIQTEDIIVLLAACALVGYNLVPDRLSRERDFALLFVILLNTILVLPLLIARAYYADFEKSVDLYSWVALAPETSAVLGLLGVSNTVHSVPGFSAPGLTFTPQHFSTPVTLVITTACSGIYSFGIFGSAFLAFALTESKEFSRPLLLFMGLGLLTAYAANVLRMVMIVLVGYYTDSAQTDLQNMLVAHSYAGWLIFLGWIAVFWWALFNRFPEMRGTKEKGIAIHLETRLQACCVICLRPLTPSIAASRCACGSCYHRRCFEASIRCPTCGQPADTGRGQIVDGN